MTDEEIPAADMDLSEDGLLDRRVRVVQPAKGYRAGSDAVLLAAATPVSAGDVVLDAGAGVGAVSLCLAFANPAVTVRGIELQSDLVELASGNIRRNHCADRVEILQGDVGDPPPAIRGRQFDHVVCNPPFHEGGKATRPPSAGKAIAHIEEELSLADWITCCVKRARPGGSVTFIHRAERLPELTSGFQRMAAGDLRVLPLWPSAGKPARRVIVQALAQGRGPARLLPGIAMHDEDGADSDAARRLLRDGYRIDMSADGAVMPPAQMG
jgi:tRNA1(Val) A37 N6-methylase TrmN6